MLYNVLNDFYTCNIFMSLNFILFHYNYFSSISVYYNNKLVIISIINIVVNQKHISIICYNYF